MNKTIKIKRGLKADLTLAGVVVGEPKFTTDTKELFIGDGTDNIQVGGDVLALPMSTATKTYVDAQDLTKADKLVLTNIVSNGDLLTDTNTDNIPDGFTITGTTSSQSLINGVLKYTTTSSEAGLVKISLSTIAGDKWYAYAYIRTTGSTYMDGFNSYSYLSSSLYNQWAFLSKVSTSISNQSNYLGIYALQNQTIEIDYMGAINLTAVFGAGKEPTKEQMDSLIALKGYFDTTEISLKDLYKLKADKLVLTNLVANGDLLTAKPSPYENQPLGFTLSSLFINADLSLSNGVLTMKATNQYAQFQAETSIPTSIGDKVYYFSRLKSLTSSSTVVSFFSVSPTQQNYLVANTNDFQFISNVSTRANTSFMPYINDNRSSDWSPIEVDYIGAINLTATFGAGNEPTKEQMDAIIKLKGYFDTTTIDIKDLLVIDKYQETRMTPTLTNATTTYLTYRKDDLGYVDIVGNLTITTFGTNFTLPGGYRPLTQLRLPIITSTNTLGYIIINTNGTVVSNANATIYINSRFATI